MKIVKMEIEQKNGKTYETVNKSERDAQGGKIVKEITAMRKAKATFKQGANIPTTIKRNTTYYMNRYNLDLYDAFKEACRDYHGTMPEELFEAWYNDDFREYIPSAYRPEYL